MAKATRNYSPEELERRRQSMVELNRRKASGELIPRRERWKQVLVEIGVNEELADEVIKLDVVTLNPEPPKRARGKRNIARAEWLARQRKRADMDEWSREELIEELEALVHEKLLADPRSDGEPVVGVPHIEERINPAKLMDHEPIPASARSPQAIREHESVQQPMPEPDYEDEELLGMEPMEDRFLTDAELARDHEGKPVPMDEPVSELEPPHVRVFRRHLAPDDQLPYQQRLDRYCA